MKVKIKSKFIVCNHTSFFFFFEPGTGFNLLIFTPPLYSQLHSQLYSQLHSQLHSGLHSQLHNWLQSKLH